MLWLFVLLAGDPAAEGEAALRAGRCAEAIPLLREAVREHPEAALAWYNLGYCYRKTERFRDAIAAYERYAALRPQSPDPYYGLGVAKRAVGDAEGARAALRKYIELERRPSEQRWVERAQQALAELERAPAPKATPPPAPAAAPPHPDALIPFEAPSVRATKLKTEGDTLRDLGRLAEAESRYRAALAADPKLAAAANELGSLYFKQDRFGDAIQVLEQAVHLDPSYALAWYNLAHAYHKASRGRDAVAAYETYSKLRPDDPDPYYGLGQAYRDLGEKAKALQAFRLYVEREKRPSEQKWVARAKQEIGALEGSGTSTSTNTSTSTSTSTITSTMTAAEQYRAGVRAAVAGQLEEAIVAWEQALRLDPGHRDARRDLERARARLAAEADRTAPDDRLRAARIDLENRRFAAALLEVDRVLRARPDDAEALLARAQARRHLGDAAGALADAQRTLALRPGAPAPLRALGEAYRALGDRARADYYLGLFLAVAEGDPALAAAAREVRAELGN